MKLKLELDHLKYLYSEFENYFPKINTESITMRLSRNLFIIIMDDFLRKLKMNFLV